MGSRGGVLQEAFGVNVTISDLRRQPEFADTIADRVWRTWWQPRGVELSAIAKWVREGLVGGQGVPTVFVAHEGTIFAGAASLIVNDLDERPQYTPWMAAVWVEPEFRSQKIGARLVEAGVQAAFAAGRRRVYLCARKERASYYDQLGWTRIEENVGPVNLTVFKRDQQKSAA